MGPRLHDHVAPGAGASPGALLLPAVALLCHVFPQSNGLPTPQATIEYRTVQVQAGIQLDVAVAGPARAKDAMVLLHGYPECSWFWRGVVDPLLKGGDLQLWMPDQRGFNHSSKPNGITSYNVTDLVADIVGLVGHLQSERGDPAGSKVHVLGHDWGGPVAWLVAGWHPEITKTLTILNGPHPSIFIDELRHDHEQQQRSSYMLFFDTPAASLVDPADMFKGAQWWDAATARAYAAAYEVKGARDSTLNWYRANIFAGKENVKAFSPNMPSNLPPSVSISPPTLVLWGMGDTAFDNEQNLAKLAPLVPNLTIKRYAGVSHWIAQEVPDRVATDVKAFLATQCLLECQGKPDVYECVGACV